jgi:peroxiredoxin
LVNVFHAIVMAVAAASAAGLASIRYGAPPPEFDVPTPHGATPLFTLRGKPVVINFWATWCPPCTQELPYFQRLARTYRDRIVLVTISNEPTGVARAYLIAHHFDFELLEDTDGRVFEAYGASPIPDTVVLDSHGNVLYATVGELDWGQLSGAVQKALGSSGVPPAAEGSAARSKATSPIGSPPSGLLR